MLPAVVEVPAALMLSSKVHAPRSSRCVRHFKNAVDRRLRARVIAGGDAWQRPVVDALRDVPDFLREQVGGLHQLEAAVRVAPEYPQPVVRLNQHRIIELDTNAHRPAFLIVAVRVMLLERPPLCAQRHVSAPWSGQPCTYAIAHWRGKEAHSACAAPTCRSLPQSQCARSTAWMPLTSIAPPLLAS